MRENRAPPNERWAQFRFSVIGGLLASPPEAGELQHALRELAERLYQHPVHPGQSLRLGFSTIEHWYYQARDAQDPVGALSRKVRADAGRAWAMSSALLSALEAQYRAHPRWTVQLQYDNLAAAAKGHPEWGPIPSYQTVRRRMREKGWVRRLEPARPTPGQAHAARRREQREVRSYEASHVHALWLMRSTALCGGGEPKPP